MLTPESSQGAGQSRFQQEVTPGGVSPGEPGDAVRGQQHTTPGKNFPNLHFNSQQYRTPSSHPHELHQLRHHVASPLCETPPNMGSASGVGARATPRGVPRCVHARAVDTPSSSARSSCSSLLGMTPGRSLISTPSGILYNPFEIDPEKMKGWILSPGIFATKSDSEKGASPFWSIDHIAMMKPVDIDERGVQSTRLMGSVEPEMEERAQRAIDQFFAANDFILPSPWSEDNCKKRTFQWPQTPVTPGGQLSGGKASSPSAPPVANEKAKDVSCQTTLSVPMDVDLQKILGKYHTQEAGKEEGSPDPLSTSSLRRKLFFHGEESTPPSPVQVMDSHKDGAQAGCGLSMEDVVISTGALCSTPESFNGSHHTPNSKLFSSSPIRSSSDSGSHTLNLRRCSTAPNLMGSPALSPIGSSQKRINRHGALNNAGYAADSAALCEPLEATPSSRWSAPSFTSPGVSPIRLEVSRCTLMKEVSLDQISTLDNHASSPKQLPVKSPQGPSSMTGTLPPADIVSTSGDKAMEVDYTDCFNKEPEQPEAFCCSGEFEVLRGFTGFCDTTTDPADDEAPLHPAHSTQVGVVAGVGQDTGYQTNSLESMTQPDLMAHHTNLTNQFGNLLPLSLQNDTGLEDGYVSNNAGTSMDFVNHPGDRTDLFSSTRITCSQSNLESHMRAKVHFKYPHSKQKTVTVHDRSDDMMKGTSFLDESLILRQARKALARPDSYAMHRHSVDLGVEDMAREHTGVYASEIQSHWNVSVPTPLRKKLHEVGLIDSPDADGTNQILPSSVALKALQRAGEDVEKYCQPARPSTLSLPKPNIILKEILRPDLTDPAFHDVVPHYS